MGRLKCGICKVKFKSKRQYNSHVAKNGRQLLIKLINYKNEFNIMKGCQLRCNICSKKLKFGSLKKYKYHFESNKIHQYHKWSNLLFQSDECYPAIRQIIMKYLIIKKEPIIKREPLLLNTIFIRVPLGQQPFAPFFA